MRERREKEEPKVKVWCRSCSETSFLKLTTVESICDQICPKCRKPTLEYYC